ncbi:MAG: protein phosphatase [Massilia sp.]|nr:protein phosphatase [Massilia sp.]
MLVSPPLDFGKHFDIAAASSAGVGVGTADRLENQDNFVLIDAGGRAVFLEGEQLHEVQLSDWPAGHIRLAVLDGMGGHGHGREAAEAVVAGLLGMPACDNLPTLSAYLDALHSRLQASFASLDGAGAPLRRPGTTLTLLEIAPFEAPLLYHVGDSRLYEIKHDGVAALTVDHVPATAFAMAGVLQAEEWWQQVHGEHRSQIAQAFLLGNAFADPAVLTDALYPLTRERLPPFLRHLPDRRALALRSDAMYLLASDGFWACAAPRPWIERWPALLAHCTDADAALHALFAGMEALPLEALHIDNLTAIIIRPLPRRDNGDDTYA